VPPLPRRRSRTSPSGRRSPRCPWAPPRDLRPPHTRISARSHRISRSLSRSHSRGRRCGRRARTARRTAKSSLPPPPPRYSFRAPAPRGCNGDADEQSKQKSEAEEEDDGDWSCLFAQVPGSAPHPFRRGTEAIVGVYFLSYGSSDNSMNMTVNFRILHLS
jgi:hypothetical protein